MSGDQVRELAKGNENYSASHPIKFSDFPVEKAIMIVTCMDPRSNAHEFWQLPFGPGILRNAGGRATPDVLRSIRALSVVMSHGKSTVGAVAVVHHTDCGLLHDPATGGPNFSNEFVREKLQKRVEGDEELIQGLEGVDFGSFSDVEASVLQDMAIIKNDPYLPKDLEVLGYVHDSFTGKTREVS
ncbi:hypothetical protein LTR53_017796 [Teratosphaeriaceae sp. CCFEE 6253]|nr:hypothetical protein LTR53_017796 [Teratosphaeriaceae sp. CCFEE 6253]